VFKAQRLLYHSTLGLRVRKKMKKKIAGDAENLLPHVPHQDRLNLRILVYLVIYDSG